MQIQCVFREMQTTLVVCIIMIHLTCLIGWRSACIREVLCPRTSALRRSLSLVTDVTQLLRSFQVPRSRYRLLMQCNQNETLTILMHMHLTGTQKFDQSDVAVVSH
jgi:hypothetical protein